jgi:hypothetical protein
MFIIIFFVIRIIMKTQNKVNSTDFDNYTELNFQKESKLRYAEFKFKIFLYSENFIYANFLLHYI